MHILIWKKKQKQIKTIEDQGIKYVEALKALKPEEKSRTRINGRTFSKKGKKW